MLKPTKILTKKQLIFLELFNESSLINNYYLSGGTALCGFYIPYRFSEDLDFFSPVEFSPRDILAWIKSIKSKLDFSSVDIQKSFNRNLIFLKFKRETLKTEFTFFPFPQKESQKYLKIT